MIWIVVGLVGIVVLLTLIQEGDIVDTIAQEKQAFIGEGHAIELQNDAEISLSVIIPAYNEEDRILVMLEEVMDYLARRSSHLQSLMNREGPFSAEIIVVSDGSKDRTTAVVEAFAQKHSDRDNVHFRIVDLLKNGGKGLAIKCGMLVARGAYLLMADADGATKFQDIEKLVQVVGKDGIAVGSRAHLQEEAIAKRNWLRNILMWGFHFIVYILCVRNIKDTQCGFKLFSRKAAQMLFPPLHIHRWAFDVELLYSAQLQGVGVVEVPVNWQEIDGSKISLASASVQMAFDMLKIRFLYTFGVWKTHASALQAFERKSK